MKFDVFFTPAELAGNDSAAAAVTIDVLRATSTMIEALANGARWVIPAGTVEEAQRLSRNLDREELVLGGERDCLRIEGFDLGNSPLEYTSEVVNRKQLVMTTTNGTVALLATGGRRWAKRSLVGAFLNLGAVARALAELDGRAIVVCAGREGAFALEDAVCAGLLAARLRAAGLELETNDGGAAAEILADRYGEDLPALLRSTAAGRHLAAVGLEADVALCAEIDRHDVVPELRDRQVRIQHLS